MTTIFETNPPISSSLQSPKASASREQEGGDFGNMLKSAVGNVERLQEEAERSVQAFASGEHKDIHGTMIALEKADVSFQLLTQVRNKVISAYETIMRMQV